MLLLEQREKFAAQSGAGPKLAANGGSDGFAAVLFDAAGAHAQMFTLDDDHHAMRLQDFIHNICNLGGDALLHLQASGNRINQSGQLAETGNLAARDVTNMGSSEEWRHMMLALAIVDDIPDDNQLFMLFIEGDTEHFSGVYSISGKGLLVHSGYAGRGFEQAFTLHILAYKLENFLDMMLDFLPIGVDHLVYILFFACQVIPPFLNFEFFDVLSAPSATRPLLIFHHGLRFLQLLLIHIIAHLLGHLL